MNGVITHLAAYKSVTKGGRTASLNMSENSCSCFDACTLLNKSCDFFNTANTLSIRLKDWGEGQYTVSRIEDGAETVVTECTALENLSLAPGDYVVTRTE